MTARFVFLLALLASVIDSSAVQAQTVRIAVVGDSNVFGKGVSPSENYPTKLEQALRAKGLDVKVINSGVNGDTTSRVLARLDSAAPAGTKVAVVWVGINDRKQGASDEAVKAGRNAIASRLRAKGIDVLVIDASVYDNQIHKDPKYNLGDGHLNGAGHSHMVTRTVKRVEAMVAKAKSKG